MTRLLEINGLDLSLDGHPILAGIQLSVAEGELHTLVGANGAGKSSLAYCLMGCAGYRPSAGQIRFARQDIAELPLHERARLGLALAWQEPARFDGLRVADFLSVGAKEDLGDCLAQVGLAPKDYLERPLDKTLSGGERKRIELAGILALRPRLAILDEPTAGIDFPSQDEMVRVIQALAPPGGGAPHHPPGVTRHRGGPGHPTLRRAHRLPGRGEPGDRELQVQALPTLRRGGLRL
jgi:Fe-S cluster assembly ATP-binding protein